MQVAQASCLTFQQIDNHMTDEEKKAFRTVIDYLDKQMQEAPNRELADTSNYLEAELTKNG
jgi:hypothetical protein